MGRPRKRIRIAPPEDEDFILETSRHANDMRLKSTFESIFTKYARDFTRVGDEIDIATGQIIVDNGHIAGMRDEQDVGQGDAQRFLRALTSTENETTGHMLDSASVGIENYQEEADRLESRKQGSTPIADTSRSLSAGHPQQSSLNLAMLQELSKTIASLIVPYITGLAGPSQAVEPAWRIPNIVLAMPKTLPNTAVRTPAIRCRRASPKNESLWAVPGRRASATHARATTGQLEWHGRILDDDSEVDELSPVGSVVYNGTRNLKQAREKRRSFPPFSREEDQRLIQMREGPDFDKTIQWKDICRKFPGRPLWSLMYRYNKHLKTRAVESSPVLQETSSPIRSYTDGLAFGDMLPSPVSIESQGADRRTITSHTKTPHTAAYISRDEDEQPSTVVAKEAFFQHTDLRERRLRSRNGRFRSSESLLDSVVDEARTKEENGGSNSTPIVVPSSDSLDAESLKLSQVEVSQSSAAIWEIPDVMPASPGIALRTRRAARRVKERRQLQSSGQATPSRSFRTCQVIIPAHDQHDTPVAEPSSERSCLERSITQSKANKPPAHSGRPARCITPTREDNSPKSTKQHAIRFNKRKQSCVSRAAATPNSSRRPISKLILGPDSEDELAL